MEMQGCTFQPNVKRNKERIKPFNEGQGLKKDKQAIIVVEDSNAEASAVVTAPFDNSLS